MLLKRLFRLIALLGLLLAPAGMLGSHAAMAMPQHGAPMAMSHCDDQKQAPKGHSQQAMIDCALACSAMPAAQPFPLPHTSLIVAAFEPAAPAKVRETVLESATPPPRSI